MTNYIQPEIATFDADDIANDILANRCVLLLGPDLFHCGGISVSEAMRLYLRQKHARHLAHLFEREGLFKFSDEKAKRRVQTDVIPEFFNAVTADESVLKKLLAIPFHLVLQVSPDTFLSDADRFRPARNPRPKPTASHRTRRRRRLHLRTPARHPARTRLWVVFRPKFSSPAINFTCQTDNFWKTNSASCWKNKQPKK